MNRVDTIKKILRKHRFKIHSGSIPKGFTWEPDVLVWKGNRLVAFLVRESNTIPEVLVQRISSTRIAKNRLSIYIVFFEKPLTNAVKIITLYGVGIEYVDNAKLEIISESKDFSTHKAIPKKKIEKIAKMSRTDIFISSHQIIEERATAKETINMLNYSHKFPIFPILAEEDPMFTIPRTKDCIKANMNRSELFLGILAKEYRAIVKFEIEEAFKTYFKSQDIILFVKNLKQRSNPMCKLIKWIEDQNTVKYQPYSDSRDFEAKLSHVLMVKIKEIHKKKKIPFLE